MHLRACAWCGPLFLGVLGLGFVVIAGFLPPPREHWSAERVAEFYRDNETRIKAGMELLAIFGCLYYFWTLAVAHVMERTEGRGSLLVRIQVFGGLTTTIVAVLVGIVFTLAAFRAGDRDPQDIRLLNDAGWFVFNLTVMFTWVQMMAMALAWLRPVDEPAVPRWLGYATLWFCLTFFVVFLTPFVQHGPFAWHGLVTFYVELGLFGAWMLTASAYVIRAVRD